ncbi:MAG: winged helix-turn-helix transcriptional regulator, partial [Mesorhizobium sp.]
MKRLRSESVDLDAADMKILRLLEEDARISTAELARSVGLSAPSVAERLKRLQENGVIEAYSVRINP